MYEDNFICFLMFLDECLKISTNEVRDQTAFKLSLGAHFNGAMRFSPAAESWVILLLNLVVNCRLLSTVREDTE